jgi:hypothetical protein
MKLYKFDPEQLNYIPIPKAGLRDRCITGFLLTIAFLSFVIAYKWPEIQAAKQKEKWGQPSGHSYNSKQIYK